MALEIKSMMERLENQLFAFETHKRWIIHSVILG